MFKKWLQSVVFIAIALVIPATIFGSSQKEISVKLKSLEAIKTQEKRGDELFISVTEFPKEKLPIHYQIPASPSHWLSRYLTNVKDVVIWKKALEHCEPVDLLITLVEEDYEPWNLDDALGSIELKLTCEKGKAKEQWIIPEKDRNNVKNQGNAFTFNKDNAQYKAVFTLEDGRTRAQTSRSGPLP